jgi:hypothetical protein
MMPVAAVVNGADERDAARRQTERQHGGAGSFGDLGVKVHDVGFP